MKLGNRENFKNHGKNSVALINITLIFSAGEIGGRVDDV